MKKLKGFTLVELVIVIAIVIILSVVSVPIYRGYTRQAKWSEAYALLGTIFSSQKAYYSQYGYFLSNNDSSIGGINFSCLDEVLGIDARGNKYFTVFRYRAAASPEFMGAAVVIPKDLCVGEKSYLQLNYNVTVGSYFKETKENGF